MQIQPTRILSSFRISLPKEFIDQIHVKEGDYVGYTFSDGKLVIQAIKVEVRK